MVSFKFFLKTPIHSLSCRAGRSVRKLRAYPIRPEAILRDWLTRLTQSALAIGSLLAVLALAGLLH